MKTINNVVNQVILIQKSAVKSRDKIRLSVLVLIIGDVFMIPALILGATMYGSILQIIFYSITTLFYIVSTIAAFTEKQKGFGFFGIVISIGWIVVTILSAS